MFVLANLPAAAAIAAGLFTGMVLAVLLHSSSAGGRRREAADDAAPDLRLEHALEAAEALTPQQRIWVLHWLEARYEPPHVGGGFAPSGGEGLTTR